MSEPRVEPMDLDVHPCPAGVLEQVSPLVRRLVAPNGGAFTFTGTCSYLVGKRRLAIIDPGPENDAHIAGLMDAIGSAEVAAIVITHTHRDHSPAARALKAQTGAPIIGCAPHFGARALALGETNPMDAANDAEYAPDRVMMEGERFEGDGFSLTALATPGHTMNHLCFALEQESALFSGDHVMAWSTSIVAPPDGAMGAYMASLEKLKGRGEKLYWPGHGGPVRDPQRFVRGLLGHRRARESAIMRRIEMGDRQISAIVDAIYEGLNPKLHGAAALSVFAHLEALVAQGKVRTDGAPRLGSDFFAQP